MTATTTTSRAAALRSIEREVGVLVHRVRRVIGVRARAVHPDLQPAAYLVLADLDERGPSRSSVVVEALGIDKGAVSRQIQHLVDLGLLERSPDPADGRAALLSLSDDARARLERVRDDRRERFGERLAEWSAGDLTELAGLLARYNASLESPTG